MAGVVAPIETRSDLLDALGEAARLEHSLMVQYLFAAFTVPTRPDGDRTRRAAELAREAKRIVLEVAREEMMHLGLVSNLLAAFGGEAAMRVPLTFPKPSRWFPNPDDSPETFALEPLTEHSIGRFIRFEAPDEVPAEAGVLSSVGDLYRAIAHAVVGLERELFVPGGRSRQETDEWGNHFKLDAVDDTPSALRCIERIVVEGEGGPDRDETSHHARFLRIRETLLPAMPRCLPAGPNPTLRDVAVTDDRTPVAHPPARELMRLFDDAYTTTLLLLELLYRFPHDLREERGELRDAIRRSMSGLIRPLGEVLVTLPSGVEGRNAGPEFMVDVEFQASDDPHGALAVIEERAEETTAAASRLAAAGGPLAGRQGVAASAGLLAGRIADLRRRLG